MDISDDYVPYTNPFDRNRPLEPLHPADCEPYQRFCARCAEPSVSRYCDVCQADCD